MHYRDLIRAHRVFRAQFPFDEPYDRITKLLQGKDSLGVRDGKAILRFLNQWRCRIPKKPEVPQVIADAFNHVIFPRFQGVRDGRLEHEHLNDPIRGDDPSSRLDWVISGAYDQLATVGYRIKDTAVSKMLHIASPGLIVMWDRSIRMEYIGHTGGSGHEFAFMFLLRMRKEIREAVESFGRARGISEEKAADDLMKKGDGRTLAKLADEYNYVRYTGKVL